MISVLFVFTAVVCVYFIVRCLGLIMGNSITMPQFNDYISLGTTFVHIPSIAFQIWFWADHFKVI